MAALSVGLVFGAGRAEASCVEPVTAEGAVTEVSPSDSLTRSYLAEIVESKDGRLLDIRKFGRFRFFNGSIGFGSSVFRFDTATGAMDLVEFSLDGYKDNVKKISGSLLKEGSPLVNGTFGIYDFGAVRNYLIVNYMTGEVWHVWAVMPDQSWIHKIE